MWQGRIQDVAVGTCMRRSAEMAPKRTMLPQRRETTTRVIISCIDGLSSVKYAQDAAKNNARTVARDSDEERYQLH